jgi:hypothetical protein
MLTPLFYTLYSRPMNWIIQTSKLDAKYKRADYQQNHKLKTGHFRTKHPRGAQARELIINNFQRTAFGPPSGFDFEASHTYFRRSTYGSMANSAPTVP